MTHPLPKLSAPAIRALYHADILTLEDVAERSRVELMALHGMGPLAMRELDKHLAGLGFKLKGEN